MEISSTQKCDGDMAKLLSESFTENPQRLLQQAERWSIMHEGDAKLLLALSNICSRLQLGGKAESYLEASSSVLPSIRAHLALAKTMENRGDKEIGRASCRERVCQYV